MSINSKKKKKKPIDEIMGIEKQRIKIIKAKSTLMVAENCQSKNPHFEEIIYYFYLCNYSTFF